MKITKEEKMYLERCGYGRKDFAQIQEATRRDKTTYEMDGAPKRKHRLRDAAAGGPAPHGAGGL